MLPFLPKLAAKQIAALRGKPHASFLLAVDDIRRRGCAGAGVRRTGAGLSDICRLDLYGAWRLLTVFETKGRCILLLVAEHTRTANPYQLIYDALDISEPAEPRTKPACCDAAGRPPVDADLAAVSKPGWPNSRGHCNAVARDRAVAEMPGVWCPCLRLGRPSAGSRSVTKLGRETR